MISLGVIMVVVVKAMVLRGAAVHGCCRGGCGGAKVFGGVGDSDDQVVLTVVVEMVVARFFKMVTELVKNLQQYTTKATKCEVMNWKLH